MKIKKFFLVMALLCLFSSEVAAEINKKDAEKMQAHLNSITNLTADFTQIAPDGNISTGKFYLSRPGKLRWQYDPPTPILIVANQGLISYYDIELDQITHVPVNSTLAGLLTRKEINFSDDISLLETTNKDSVITATLQITSKPEDGKVRLVFSDSPVSLRKMEVIDSSDNVTIVSFDNQNILAEIDKSMFVLKNPRMFKKTGG